MKVHVLVKRVIDSNVKPIVKADGSGVDLSGAKMAMNLFCEITIEEAVRLKEQGKVAEVVAISIGPAQATETLRTALAMGADRGILVKTDAPVEPLAVAKILKAVVAQESPQLKNVMLHVAALIDVMQVSEIITVVSPDTFELERPMYAGNAIQTVQATDGE